MLLGWLDENVELAGEKYERIRQRLIRVFIGRGCHEGELLADETIDRVTTKIPDIKDNYEGDPAAYFYGVAHNVHLEWLRLQKRERQIPYIDFTIDKDEEDESGYTCLESCLEKLPTDLREVILDYYRDEKRAKIERRRGLAERLGVSVGALQVRASRIRSKLSSCVNDCVGTK